MDLSTENISRLALSIVGDDEVKKIPKYQYFILEIAKYPMITSPVFEGWYGVDSKVSIISLYFAYQYKATSKITWLPESITKKKYLEFLDKVYDIYKDGCTIMGLKFVPHVPNGLMKICSRINIAG